MTRLKNALRFRRALFVFVVLAAAEAGAQGAPIQFTITELGGN